MSLKKKTVEVMGTVTRDLKNEKLKKVPSLVMF